MIKGYLRYVDKGGKWMTGCDLVSDYESVEQGFEDMISRGYVPSDFYKVDGGWVFRFKPEDEIVYSFDQVFVDDSIGLVVVVD